MFPTLQYEFCHLDHNVNFPSFIITVSSFKQKRYRIFLDIPRISPHRLKYNIKTWNIPELNPDHLKPQQLTERYEHPDSPNSASFWLKNGASFAKIKLTNRPNFPTNKCSLDGLLHHDETPLSFFPINSFFAYIPRLHIESLDNDKTITTRTFLFPECQFVAVTHYQNEQINRLKKQHNPHAKSFKVCSTQSLHVDLLV